MSLDTQHVLSTRNVVARVDLLPAEAGQARDGRVLKVGLAAGLLGVLAVAGAACVLTAGHVDAATEALADEQQRTLQLQTEQRAYAEVPTVLAQLQSAQEVQREVTASDVPVYALLDRLAGTAPAGTTFTALQTTVAGTESSTTTTTDGAAATAATADPLAVAGIGAVSLTGQTRDQGEVATWMDQAAALPELADVRLTTSALDPATGIVTFSATATLTDDALLSAQ
ncbi:PilN domain-containing protein [Kineococcus sp. SYSU DK002]|uniref:PilN domain-containing protein n=1 Tax=Kineococcus sp. SYSU DK002 TaxID=3383123 RepID=UPI003D7E9B0C